MTDEERPDVPIVQFWEPQGTYPQVSTKSKIEILDEAESIESAYRKLSEKNFLCFCRGLTIASQKGPRVFEGVMADFQRRFFEEVAPSLEAVAKGEPPPCKRWWVERTKKAAKDSDLAVILLWFLAFPQRPIYLQVGAANKEQAAIVKERMVHLLHWNEWLNDLVEVVQWEVRSKKRLADGSPMARLHIMSSDIAGAHGGTPDVLIVNELSHVTRWEFVENLMDNADGVDRGIAIIATNAGYKGTKAELWRHNAMRNDGWIAHVLARPAPWHSKETIADAKRRNILSRYKRLWEGFWPSGKGDALREDVIEWAFCLDGPSMEREVGWDYLAGLDLGISHDHSALVVLGVNVRMQKLKVVWWKSWSPDEPTAINGQINLSLVEAACRFVHTTWGIRSLLYDPHQAVLLAQRCALAGVPVREMTFSSTTNLTEMATGFLQVLESRKLDCYDDADGRMRRDFGKFNIVEKPYGYKLEAVSDEFGHADVGTALVITIPAAVKMLDGFDPFAAGDDLILVNEKNLSEEEEENLPDEFKRLIHLDDGRKRRSDPFTAALDKGPPVNQTPRKDEDDPSSELLYIE